MQGALDGGEGIGGGGGEDHHLDPEARVQPLQLFREEAFQVVRVARRPAGADVGAGHGAVDPVERQLQPPRAPVRPFQPRAQVVEQPPRGGADVFAAPDGLGEGQAGAQGGRRAAGRDGLVAPPQGLVQALHDGLAEAGGERRPGQPEKVADAAQADAVQAFHRRRRQAQPGHRQSHERVAGFPRRDDDRGACPVPGEAGHGPGRARGVGGRREAVETEAVQASAQVFQQRRFAAEQVGAAADVQPHAVAAVDRRPRGVAAAPVGQRRQRPPVAGRIGRGGAETGHQGAGVGERQSRDHPGGPRRRGGGGYAQAPLGGGDGGQRRPFRGRRLRPPAGPRRVPPPGQPVGGEARQPQ